AAPPIAIASAPAVVRPVDESTLLSLKVVIFGGRIFCCATVGGRPMNTAEFVLLMNAPFPANTMFPPVVIGLAVAAESTVIVPVIVSVPEVAVIPVRISTPAPTEIGPESVAAPDGTSIQFAPLAPAPARIVIGVARLTPLPSARPELV